MYRISFEKLEEIYAYETGGKTPDTATIADFEAVDGVNAGETFGAWFDRIKPELDVYEESNYAV